MTVTDKQLTALKLSFTVHSLDQDSETKTHTVVD